MGVQEGRTITEVKNPRDKGVSISFRMEVENLTQEKLTPVKNVMESGKISDTAPTIDVSHILFISYMYSIYTLVS